MEAEDADEDQVAASAAYVAAAAVQAVRAPGPGYRAEEMFKALYVELRRLARVQLARNSGQGPLGTISLLHEAFVVMRERSEATFPDRARFVAYAARVMRSVLIDHVRSRNAQKRQGQARIVTLDEEPSSDAEKHDYSQLQELSDALDELAKLEPDLAEVVDLKFFCGFSYQDIAALQACSDRTVLRKWEKARVYLFDALHSR